MKSQNVTLQKSQKLLAENLPKAVYSQNIQFSQKLFGQLDFPFSIGSYKITSEA